MGSKSAEPRRKNKKKQKKRGNVGWIVFIFLLTVLISSTISFLSSTLLAGAGLVGAFLVLFVIIFIGIIFDIIGVAVMSANEKPLHSMAARKRPGAAEALKLLRSAEKVSSFCNDVVGDICGVVSGAASAVVAALALSGVGDLWSGIIMSALVAGATIAGKACGKNIAMNNATTIVYMVSKPIYYTKLLFRRKNKKKKH